MSSPMPELPEHEHMPVNAEGLGPETDPAKVVKTICWFDGQDWPCDQAEQG